MLSRLVVNVSGTYWPFYVTRTLDLDKVQSLLVLRVNEIVENHDLNVGLEMIHSWEKVLSCGYVGDIEIGSFLMKPIFITVYNAFIII